MIIVFKNSTSDNTSNDITNYCKPTETVFSAESFKANLAKGFFNTKMNQVQSNTMLKILHTHPQLNFLPTDCRSLLKTPREKIQTKIIPPGEYLHLGLESTLKSILSLVSLESIPRELIIDFNTDGVELNKNIQLWPIQIRVINLSHDKPELIGIYEGVKKPNSFTDFFLDFVQEVKSIEEEGGIIFNGNLIYLKFRCFIADAPARAYVLNHASHVAKYPCSKCHVEGITFHKSNRFVGINHKLRTDLEYRMLSDVDHHKGKSAIHDLPINLVNQVPFDYMHLVCLGVMKKIIGSILLGTSITKNYRNSKSTLCQID
ncbi:uncharacterized protein LOC141526157 [Cotesia typhae]|uniref:uncharacterized protein LOC141526157 n=1 Tax=Cotesia typhae TaxID=2053667 RepID=UPI003D68998E